jgi:purine nucleosidase
MAGMAMHDVHALMPLLRPDLYTSERVFVDVETKGELTRGMTVADWRNVLERPAQTEVLLSVAEAGFLAEYQERIGRLP